jgi:hypothetical protein
MTDIRRNPNGWSDEALDVFWTTYDEIQNYMKDNNFHHPAWSDLANPHVYSDDKKEEINDTIAWNAAWVAADVVDFKV